MQKVPPLFFQWKNKKINFHVLEIDWIRIWISCFLAVFSPLKFWTNKQMQSDFIESIFFVFFSSSSFHDYDHSVYFDDNQIYVRDSIVIISLLLLLLIASEMKCLHFLFYISRGINTEILKKIFLDLNSISFNIYGTNLFIFIIWFIIIDNNQH